jgi:putative ABC transport system ATP-binding protein
MILSLENVSKTYSNGEARVDALRGISFKLQKGDFVACVGPSGCGKSTLLHICGAMDRPSMGRVAIEGRDFESLSDDRLTTLRRERVGFVFQFFNLLPTLTLEENIALPLMLAGVSDAAAETRARELAERVGLSGRIRHYPAQLSGGEMQRAAIARAIIHKPALLLADEPTGNLDSVNGGQVLHLLKELNRDTDMAIILATHSSEAAAAARTTFHMKDGRIESSSTEQQLSESGTRAAL